MLQRKKVGLALLPSLWLSASALAGTFVEPITGFETDRDGNPTTDIFTSYGDLQVIMFQDPANSPTTDPFIQPKLAFGGALPDDSSEESAVSSFLGGADASPKSLVVFFSWEDAPLSPDRWARVTTNTAPKFPNPAIHLGGKVRIKIRVLDAGFGNSNTDLAFALLVRETGNDIPQGLDGGTVGALEFVGVSAVNNAGTTVPTPVGLPAYTLALSGSFVTLEWSLPDLQTSGNVLGWTQQGGDGVLDGTRGVLEALAIMPAGGGRDVSILVDSIEFEAPDVDPTFAPRLGTPLIATQTSVTVHDVLSTSTDVQVEVDLDSAGGGPFVVDATYNVTPGNSPDELNVNVPVAALAVGDRVRARQTNPPGDSDYSLVLTVNPPAKLSFSISVDEDGNSGLTPPPPATNLDFLYVGASSLIPTPAGDAPQGKPAFAANAVWQTFDIFLDGSDPVLNFAGDGELSPDGGLFNVDAMWMSIDTTEPISGPYDIWVDGVQIVNPDNSVFDLIDGEDGINRFNGIRTQSTVQPPDIVLSLPNTGSYNGSRSHRMVWNFADASLANTASVLQRTSLAAGTATPFDDTALAVRFHLVVRDTPTPGAPAIPTVTGPVVGDQSMVRVTGDPAATAMQLLVEGVAFGAPVVPVAGVADIPVSGLAVGTSLSATQTLDTEGTSTSDPAFPRADQNPIAPNLVAGVTAASMMVTVGNVHDTVHATASLVEVLADDVVVGSAPGGTATVIVPTSALVALTTVTARQTVNGVVSPPSAPVVVPPGELPKVVINEIQYDDSSTDDREFVELYNYGETPVDISGWVLRASDELAPPGDNNADYTVPGVVGSNTTVLAAGDYYVFGAATVPNVDQVVGVNDLWENTAEGLQLIDGLGVIVDTLIYELSSGPVAISPGEGNFWGAVVSIDNNGAGTKPPVSLARWIDGGDTDNNGRDFGEIQATPGASNDPAFAPIVLETFDAGVPPGDVPGFTGTFVNLRYMDPAVAGALPTGPNPNVIPSFSGAAGDLAAIAWDGSGGGNAVLHVSEARTNYAFELDIYVDADAAGDFVAGTTADEHESWSIGFGTTNNNYSDNAADTSVPPIPTAGATGVNGDTGLAWKYIKFENANTGELGGQLLRLVNENDGGPDGVVLYSVDPGLLTTGWHHLTLSRAGDNVIASFDTATFNTTLAGNGPSSFFIGYREALFTNANSRPPTIDNLVIGDALNVPFDIVSANPPTDNPYIGGLQPFRDTLQTGTTAALTQGIGAAGTPAQGTISYAPISVTFSSTPIPAPAPGNVEVCCSGGTCPTVTGVSGSGVGPYSISLSGAIPPGHCTTLEFRGASVGQKLQYQYLPVDVNYSNSVSPSDALVLLNAINNGSANVPANLARYNINRIGSVSASDTLRAVGLLNGVNTTQSWAGAVGTACLATCP